MMKVKIWRKKLPNLSFIAADVLAMPLYSRGDSIYGADRKNFKIGPFSMSLWAEAQSSFMDGKEVGMMVMCSKRLWLYLFITPSHTCIAVFDALEAMLSKSNWDTMNGMNIKMVLKDLNSKKAIKSWYEFVNDKKWVEMKEEEVKKLCN